MRLIDADALKESVHVHDYVLKDCLNSTDKGMFTVGIMQAIDEQPTVDAVPVRHGMWTRHILGSTGGNGTTVMQCSECESMTISRFRYCPNCGARMDAE